MENSIFDKMNKAIDMMEGALEKYRKGEYEMAERRRDTANKLFDEAVSEANTEEGEDKMMYGDNINFGKVYQVFESNTEKMFATVEGKKGLAEIVNTIKSDRVLNEQFATYNAFMNPKNVSDSNSFVNDIYSMLNTRTQKELKEANMKFLKAIKKHKLDESKATDTTNDNLFESIEKLITTPKTVGSINTINEAKAIASEYVSEMNVDEGESIENVVEDMQDKLVERYIEEMTEDEMDFINEMTSPNVDLENVFNTTKEKLKWRINEAILNDRENSEQWKNLSEKISGKTYIKENAIGDIAEMIESLSVFD